MILVLCLFKDKYYAKYDTIFIVKHDILLQGIDKYSEIIHDRIYYIKNKSLYYKQKNEIILNQYKEKKT